MHSSKQHSWCPCGTNRRAKGINFSPSMGFHFALHQTAINKEGLLCVSLDVVSLNTKYFLMKYATINLSYFFLFRPIFESKARRLSGVQTMMNGNSLIIFTKICFTLLNKSLITLVEQMVFLSLAVNSIKVAGLLSVYLLAY